MLHRDSSIFYKLTAENEDSVTDLLCNLFRIRYIRDICFDYFGIEKNIYQNIEIDNVFTRRAVNGVKPDICIENEEILCFIENKIYAWTDLQPSQITTYPDYLAKSKKKKTYLFIIPKNYNHEEEINQMLKNHDFVKIIYWDEFLRYLFTKEINTFSSIINESLEYMKGLILNDDLIDKTLNIYEVALMYNPKDIYDVLSLLGKSMSLINNASQKAVSKLGKNFSLGNKQTDINGYGIYYKFNDTPCMFCGLNLNLCEEGNGDFVYSLAITIESLKEDFSIDRIEYPYFSDGEYIYIKIDRRAFLNENDLFSKIIDIIEKIFLINKK